jgi:signal transduction histidine kinase
LQSTLNSKLASARGLTDETITSTQKLASELRPGYLDRLGLGAAIEMEAEIFQSRSGIDCESNIPREVVAISQDGATAMFRIFQELLTNVARHAHASRINVRLNREGDSLVLRVSDNGVGMRRSDLESPKSLGLLGMQERSAELGGQITFEGRAGVGTTATVRLPLESKVRENA